MSIYSIRPMQAEDMRFAMALAEEEGWNPGVDDADCFYQADSAGFFLASLDQQPIGCISAVCYPPNFGFIGLYIVAAAYRRQGYGFALWQRAMAHLKNTQNIGLDGVVEQQSNYQTAGFRLAHRNIRYQATFAPTEWQSESVVALAAVDFADLCAYDSRYFPAHRARFLRHWISAPNAHACAFVDHNALLGYGVLRRCVHGYKVGPLFAQDSRIAKRVFSHLLSHLEKATTVSIDVPQINPAAVQLAEHYGMTPCFQTARMYTNGMPNIVLEHVFGITTFELG